MPKKHGGSWPVRAVLPTRNCCSVVILQKHCGIGPGVRPGLLSRARYCSVTGPMHRSLVRLEREPVRRLSSKSIHSSCGQNTCWCECVCRITCIYQYHLSIMIDVHCVFILYVFNHPRERENATHIRHPCVLFRTTVIISYRYCVHTLHTKIIQQHPTSTTVAYPRKRNAHKPSLEIIPSAREKKHAKKLTPLQF